MYAGNRNNSKGKKKLEKKNMKIGNERTQLQQGERQPEKESREKGGPMRTCRRQWEKSYAVLARRRKVKREKA